MFIVPSLAKLTALRMLDLSHSGIKEILQGMEMLVSLKYLNLFARNLEILPTGIFPKLTSLQFLMIYGPNNYFIRVGEDSSETIISSEFILSGDIIILYDRLCYATIL